MQNYSLKTKIFGSLVAVFAITVLLFPFRSARADAYTECRANGAARGYTQDAIDSLCGTPDSPGFIPPPDNTGDSGGGGSGGSGGNTSGNTGGSGGVPDTGQSSGCTQAQADVQQYIRDWQSLKDGLGGVDLYNQGLKRVQDLAKIACGGNTAIVQTQRDACIAAAGTNTAEITRCSCGNWTTETPKSAAKCPATSGFCGTVGNSPCSNGQCDGQLVVVGGKCTPPGGSTPSQVKCETFTNVPLAGDPDFGFFSKSPSEMKFIRLGDQSGVYETPLLRSSKTPVDGLAVMDVGPLLFVTIKKQIPLLRDICNATRSLSDDIKAIRVSVNNIDITTKAIKEDTGALVKKEYELDPAAREAAATAINDEKKIVTRSLVSGRPQGIKEDASPDSNNPYNQKPKAGQEVRESFTPDINTYEQLARKNAGELFYGELATYFAQEDPKNRFKDEILQQVSTRADSEYDQLRDRFARLDNNSTKSIDDAKIIVNSLYDEYVNKVASNAIAEYIAGGTVIGGKTCSKDDLVLTSYKDAKTGELIDTVTCRTEGLKIVTPAPVVKNLMERFGTTELTQAEMADEYQEKAHVSGISVDLLKNSLPKSNTSNQTGTTSGTEGTAIPNTTGTSTGQPIASGNIATPIAYTTKPLLSLTSNLASVGSISRTTSVKPKSSPSPISLIVTDQNSNQSLINLSVNTSQAPTSCMATSDWLTFSIFGSLTPSYLFKEGDIIPAPTINTPQTFTITHPQLFKLSANITEPETVSAHRQNPVEQTNIKTSTVISSGKLTQTTSYIPDMSGAQVGDNITVTINSIKISLDLTNLNPIDIVRRFITEATSGRSDIVKALSAYSFSQDANILIVANKIPALVSVPTVSTYSLECNINNKTVSASTNINL